MSKLYSIVVPVMNEEGNIPLMYERVKSTMEEINENFELIYVDDGSTDASVMKLAELSEKDERVKYIKLSRNFGHQIAVTAGIDHAGGDAIVMIDGDLQDPPEFIADLIKKYNEGYDVVYATRAKRKGESIFKKLTASLFYKILRRLTKINIPLNTGDFRIIDRKVANSLKSIREQHRFIRGLTSWTGFKQIGITFERKERHSGKTKYSIGKMIKFALDGIASFSFFPIKLCIFFGTLVGTLSIILGSYIIIKHFFFKGGVSQWASTVVIILFLSGLQFLFIGIIGDYLGRIYDEVRHRPLYIIDEAIGIDKKKVAKRFVIIEDAYNDDLKH